MQFWSLEGADEAFGDFGRIDRLDSRTRERGHTETFACWLCAWDVAHIPTKRALWVLKRGAGRVDEILGFYPPDRNVPPPPGVHRYDMLIHVDRVEDWTPLSPRSSHSGQSGLPSSYSDDDRPMPRTEPGTWAAGVEDGQSRGRRLAPRIASSGCCGFPHEGGRRDHDGDDQGNGGRSWKEALLERGCHSKDKTMVVEQEPRRRSRTPAGRRHEVRTRGRSTARQGTELRATPPLPLLRHKESKTTQEDDPIAAFFSCPGRALSPPPRTDCMQLEFERAMLEALSAPLEFGGHYARKLPGEEELPPSTLLHCRAQPPAPSVELQMAAVTQQVSNIQMQDGQSSAAPHHLFAKIPEPLIAAPPPPPASRFSAPPKSRATSAPVRQSARQAAANSTVPVSQRATMRIMQQMGLLGPKDKMTPNPAAALIKKFDQPLSDKDIEAIAKLTNLDVDALRIAAGMDGPAGVADEAVM